MKFTNKILANMIFRRLTTKIMSENNFVRNVSTIQTQENLIAVCQMTSTNDKQGNFEIVEKLVEEAKRSNAKIAFLPEACDFVGSSRAETLTLAEPLDGPLVSKYKNLAKRLKIWLSLGGIHETFSENKIFNTHLIISDSGEIVSKYHKIHLFDVDIPEQNIRLMESSYVERGEFISEPVLTPVGLVGLSICYDMRFPELSLALAKKGANILTYPSAFTFATGAFHWETLLKARAIETQCYVVAAAQVGSHNSKRKSWGHAMVVNPWGEITAQCTDGQGIAITPINSEYLKQVHLHMPVWNHRRNDLYPSMETQTNKNEDSNRKFYAFGQVQISEEIVFFKTNLTIAFTNKKCVVPGHVLVAPIREVKLFADLAPEEVSDLFQVTQKIAKVMNQIHGASSSTIVVQDGPEAGQTIKHVHVHVLPRKSGDFARNDDIYTELSNHDKGEDLKWRNEEDMSSEAAVIRTTLRNLSPIV